jgi:hypothetical protein
MQTSANTIMQTFSGSPFDILAPRARDIRLLDMAEGLGSLQRFTGAGRVQYSVAQHSVLVSMLLDGTGFEMEGLFHDGHEYITNDISSPMKQAINEMVYRLTGERVDVIKAIAGPIDEAIARQFGLIYPRPPAVKAADMEALTIERRQVMHPASGVEWTTDVKCREYLLNQMSCDEATATFIARYNQLKYREKAVVS